MAARRYVFCWSMQCSYDFVCSMQYSVPAESGPGSLAFDSVGRMVHVFNSDVAKQARPLFALALANTWLAAVLIMIRCALSFWFS